MTLGLALHTAGATVGLAVGRVGEPYRVEQYAWGGGHQPSLSCPISRIHTTLSVGRGGLSGGDPGTRFVYDPAVGAGNGTDFGAGVASSPICPVHPGGR